MSAELDAGDRVLQPDRYYFLYSLEQNSMCSTIHAIVEKIGLTVIPALLAALSSIVF
jgi:hypothetical protein